VSPDHGTQRLTALAAPDDLVDWRLALCFETAHDAGILDELPARATDIAAARQLDPASVHAVLSVLAAWGYVSVDDSGAFAEGPRRLEPEERAALAQHGTWIRRWAALVPRRLRDRRAVAPEEPPSPDPATGLGLLESASRPFVGPVVDACLEDVGISSRAPGGPRVLDLGGGHGAYAREFARRGCAVVLQDLPGVIDIARADERLASAEVELFAGDAFDRLAPGPFQLVLCGTLTNMFDLDRVRALSVRVRDVLAPEGRLAIATWLRDHGPVGAAFGVQMLVATQGGDAHGESEYRLLLTEAGYTDIRIVDVGHPPLAIILARR